MKGFGQSPNQLGPEFSCAPFSSQMTVPEFTKASVRFDGSVPENAEKVQHLSDSFLGTSPADEDNRSKAFRYDQETAQTQTQKN